MDEENVNTIIAITGLDEANAAILLAETGGDMEMASNLFFSGAWEPHQTKSAVRDHRDNEEEKDGKKRRGAYTAHEENAEEREDAMRAPIASKVERLYGGGADGFADPRMMAQASAANYGVDGRPRGKGSAQPVDSPRLRAQCSPQGTWPASPLQTSPAGSAAR